MLRAIGEGLGLGLANNLYCLGACGAVFLPCLAASGRPLREPVLELLAGRLLAYLFFGLAVGNINLYFEGRLNPYFLAPLLILLSLWLIGYALGCFRPSGRLCRAAAGPAGRFLPLGAGFVLGISPCPPFLLGLSRSLAGGRFLDPILFFLGFYLGSSLWLLLLLAGGRLKAGRIFQRIGQAAALAAGIWYLGQGIRMLL